MVLLQVLYRFPEGGSSPVKDAEVASLCFPHGVAPEKLRRSPSLSSLDEVVFGRQDDGQEQCFVFQLTVRV